MLRDDTFATPMPGMKNRFATALPTVGAMSKGDGRAPALVFVPAGRLIRPVGEGGSSCGAYFVERFRGLVEPFDEHYAKYNGIRVGPETSLLRVGEAPKLRNANDAVFRAVVRAYLEGCAIDGAGSLGAAENAFAAEYDHAANRRRTPNRQARVAEWLAGLPTACGVEYRNGAILEIAAWWHGVGNMTDRQKDRIVANWFNFCAFHLVRAWDAPPAPGMRATHPRP